MEPGMVNLDPGPTNPRIPGDAVTVLAGLVDAGLLTPGQAKQGQAEIEAARAEQSVITSNVSAQSMELVTSNGGLAHDLSVEVIADSKRIREQVASGAIDLAEGRAALKRLQAKYGQVRNHIERAQEAAKTVREIEADPFGFADDFLRRYPTTQPKFSF